MSKHNNKILLVIEIFYLEKLNLYLNSKRPLVNFTLNHLLYNLLSDYDSLDFKVDDKTNFDELYEHAKWQVYLSIKEIENFSGDSELSLDIIDDFKNVLLTELKPLLRKYKEFSNYAYIQLLDKLNLLIIVLDFKE